MALVNDDLEGQPGIKSFFDPFVKVGAFAVAKSNIGIPCSIEFLPVDKTGIVFGKTARHNIGKQFCLCIVDIFIHLCLALFFQVSLSRSEPNKYSFCMPLHVFIHKMGEDDRFSAARGAFEDNIAARRFHSL